jgi:hypothetical protein
MASLFRDRLNPAAPSIVLNCLRFINNIEASCDGPCVPAAFAVNAVEVPNYFCCRHNISIADPSTWVNGDSADYQRVRRLPDRMGSFPTDDARRTLEVQAESAAAVNART